MKNLYSKIMRILLSVGSDKYLHFIVGALLFSVIAAIFNYSNWGILIGILVPTVLDVCKELFIDKEADVKDLMWTVAGPIVMFLINLI